MKGTPDRLEPGAEGASRIDPKQQPVPPVRDRRWRWSEAFSLTAGIFASFLLLVLLIALGVIAPSPLVEQILFAALTIAAVIDACRKSASIPSLVGHLLLALFFALASFACFDKGAPYLGAGYTGLAFVWFSLAVNAAVVQHRQQKQQHERLDRALEALRRAAEEQPQKSTPE